MSTAKLSHLASPRKEIQLSCAPLSIPSRYVVRFPDGSYLNSYLDSSGALHTPARNCAKIFRKRDRAEQSARLFGGVVCPEAENEEQTDARRFRSESFSTSEMLTRIIVELGGGIWAGEWPEIPGRSEKLVLFNSPKTGTTLGCLLPELSAELVRKKIRESDLRFEVGHVQP